MKWYWLTLIIVATLVIGFYIGKAMEKKYMAKASTSTPPATGGRVVALTNPDGSKKLSVVAA